MSPNSTEKEDRLIAKRSREKKSFSTGFKMARTVQSKRLTVYRGKEDDNSSSEDDRSIVSSRHKKISEIIADNNKHEDEATNIITICYPATLPDENSQLEYELAEIVSIEHNFSDLMLSTVLVIWKDGDNLTEPEKQHLHFIGHLPIFSEFIEANCDQDLIYRYKSEVMWISFHFSLQNFFKFHFVEGGTSPREYTWSQAIALTNDHLLLARVADEVRENYNQGNDNLLWYERNGCRENMAGSIGRDDPSSIEKLKMLRKGIWPVQIFQFCKQLCIMAALLSCTPSKLLANGSLQRTLRQAHNRDGFGKFQEVVHCYNEEVKGIHWSKVHECFERKKITTFLNTFGFFMKKTTRKRLFIVSFKCFCTNHVIVVDTWKKLILDTDNGEGREAPFSYDNMEEIAQILKALFDVNMEDNIVNNLYVRLLN